MIMQINVTIKLYQLELSYVLELAQMLYLPTVSRYILDHCPDATHLTMAWHVEGSRASKGTAKTSVEGMFRGGKVRKNGKIIQVPLAYKERLVNFEIGKRNAMTIPRVMCSQLIIARNLNIEFYFSRQENL